MIAVPENAGTPLQAVTISQAATQNSVSFNPQYTRASLGDRSAKETAIPLASIGGMQPGDPSAITVVFNQPIAPGSSVTIEVQPVRNPDAEIHLLGITAYPLGNDQSGLFLGHGQLQFYSPY